MNKNYKIAKTGWDLIIIVFDKNYSGLNSNIIGKCFKFHRISVNPLQLLSDITVKTKINMN